MHLQAVEKIAQHGFPMLIKMPANPSYMRSAGKRKASPAYVIHRAAVVLFVINNYAFIAGSALCKTLAAIDRFIETRFERNLGFSATLCADCVIHLSFFPGTISAILGLPCRPAFLASSGFVLETPGCIKLLLTCGEYEFFSTIFAY
jgi:hypothetical protein